VWWHLGAGSAAAAAAAAAATAPCVADQVGRVVGALLLLGGQGARERDPRWCKRPRDKGEGRPGIHQVPGYHVGMYHVEGGRGSPGE